VTSFPSRRLDSAEFRQIVKECKSSIKSFNYGRSPAIARYRIQNEIGKGNFQLSSVFVTNINAIRAIADQNSFHTPSDIASASAKPFDTIGLASSLGLSDEKLSNEENDANEVSSMSRGQAAVKRLVFRLSAIFESFQVIFFGVREPLLFATIALMFVISMASLFGLIFLIKSYQG